MIRVPMPCRVFSLAVSRGKSRLGRFNLYILNCRENCKLTKIPTSLFVITWLFYFLLPETIRARVQREVLEF